MSEIEWLPEPPPNPADLELDPLNYDRNEFIDTLIDFVKRGRLTPDQAQAALDFGDVLACAYQRGYRVSKN